MCVQRLFRCWYEFNRKIPKHYLLDNSWPMNLNAKLYKDMQFINHLLQKSVLNQNKDMKHFSRNLILLQRTYQVMFEMSILPYNKFLIITDLQNRFKTS